MHVEMENTQGIFTAITDFVADLNTEFGEKHKALSLYNTLIGKTTLSHEKPVQKHIDLFRDFCSANGEALVNADPQLLKGRIEYSEKVYIDLPEVLRLSEKDTCKAVLKHLANINALVNPTETALSLVKSLCVENSNYDFIDDIISTVTENISEGNISDPMAAAMSLLSSGKLTKIFDNMRTKFSDGTLDPNQLLKKVTQIYSDVSQGESDLPDISSIIATCTNQMQGM